MNRRPDLNVLASESVETKHVARHILKRMRGGSASLLLWDTNSKPWVTKFANNPQHRRLVLNEFLATYVAREIGLTVPKSGIIEISQELLDDWTGRQDCGDLRTTYQAGLHFGSQLRW